MPSTSLVCSWCAEEFKIRTAEFNRRTRQRKMRFFCCRSCAVLLQNATREDRRVQVIKKCLHCKKTFTTMSGSKSSSHCSRGCASANSVTPKRRAAARASGKKHLSNISTIQHIADALRAREWRKASILRVQTIPPIPAPVEPCVNGNRWSHLDPEGIEPSSQGVTSRASTCVSCDISWRLSMHGPFASGGHTSSHGLILAPISRTLRGEQHDYFRRYPTIGVIRATSRLKPREPAPRGHGTEERCSWQLVCSLFLRGRRLTSTRYIWSFIPFETRSGPSFQRPCCVLRCAPMVPI